MTQTTPQSVRLADLPIRDDLRGRSPYGAPQLDVPVCLNTNENPHPPSAALIADLADRVATAAAVLNRYPDRDAEALRADLAAYLARTTGIGVAPAQVWAANGSNEVLQQLLQAFGGPGRRALAFEPTYTMHRLISEGTGTSYVGVPRAPDAPLGAAAVVAAIAEHHPDVVFLCSPNNPTGAAVASDVVEAAYDALVDTNTGILVVDEAYAEFSHRPSAIGLVGGRPRLIVTRTMSKAFAFAGARLGYLVADPAVIDALLLVRLPYHLSTITQAAARAALAHAEELLGSVEAVKVQRDRMVGELSRLGLETVASDANFLLIGRFSDQRAIWQALLDRGILVRDVGLPGWLRVTAGTESETTAFLHAMKEVL